MITLGNIIGFFGRLTPGDYVDIACVGLALLCAVIGLIRGISNELSKTLSFILGALAGFWIFVPGVQTLEGVEFLAKKPQFAALIAFCVALFGGIICFLALNYILARIIKIVIDPIWDHSLGLVAGLLNAAVLLALAFTLAMILPDLSQRETVCRKSRSGRVITPYLSRWLHTPDKPAQEDKETSAVAVPRAFNRL